jgi:hypothetical protein
MLFYSAAFGTISTAIFVWLCLRIFNRRERWAKRALMAYVSVLVIYPLSFGPVTWLAVHDRIPLALARPLEILYTPLAYGSAQGPAPLQKLLFWYVELWVGPPQPIEFDDNLISD